MSYPHILHHGAIAGVTGSCHQLRIDEQNSLLVDCGLFQGAEVSPEGGAGLDNLAIDFSLNSIKALVTTHVHRIPYLLAAGFKGPILCSESSLKLLPIVLENAFKLGFSRAQQQVEHYLKLLEQRIIALLYDAWFDGNERQLAHQIKPQFGTWCNVSRARMSVRKNTLNLRAT